MAKHAKRVFQYECKECGKRLLDIHGPHATKEAIQLLKQELYDLDMDKKDQLFICVGTQKHIFGYHRAIYPRNPLAIREFLSLRGHLKYEEFDHGMFLVKTRHHRWNL